jgi:hypothetical protein
MANYKENVRQDSEYFSMGIRPPIDIRPPMIRGLPGGTTDGAKTLTEHFDNAPESPEEPGASGNRVAWIAILLAIVAVVVSLLVGLWPRVCACS